jgi:CDP-glycerol glycerophosphotransferase
MLITDFSSLAFDFVLLRKPCFLYAKDLFDYINIERKLLIDIKDSPFYYTNCFNDLIKYILDYDEKEYIEKSIDFLKEIGSYEKGNACSCLIERMEKEINKINI